MSNRVILSLSLSLSNRSFVLSILNRLSSLDFFQLLSAHPSIESRLNSFASSVTGHNIGSDPLDNNNGTKLVHLDSLACSVERHTGRDGRNQSSSVRVHFASKLFINRLLCRFANEIGVAAPLLDVINPKRLFIHPPPRRLYHI